jgi:peptidoglycan hydrolase-like protein with peptidoglycan-binding domain
MPTLRLGDGMLPQAARNDVAAAQRRLGIGDDGRFGPGTRAAVVALQRKRGLQPDGVIGPLTWQALWNPLPATVRA